MVSLNGGTLQQKEAGESIKEESSMSKNETTALFVIRLILFTFYFSLGSLIPFLPVYYHSLNFGGEIIGLLGAIKPFTTFCIAPMWGYISDWSNSPMLVLQLTLFTSIILEVLVAAKDDARYIMTIVFLKSLFFAPVKALLDSMVMKLIPDRTSFGRFRLWGQIGYATGTFSMGYLLSLLDDSAGDPPKDGEQGLGQMPTTFQATLDAGVLLLQNLGGYKVMFVIHAFLAVPLFFFIMVLNRLTGDNAKMDDSTNDTNVPKQLEQSTDGTSKNNALKETRLDKDTKSTNQSKKGSLMAFLQKPDVAFFFFLVLAAGINSGVSENFANLRIREVGGTSKEMGFARIAGAMTGVPMFWFSKDLAKRLGIDIIMVLTLVSSCSRFLIYAMISNPYQAMPAEALRGLTFSAYLSASSIHVNKISPPTLTATMLMVKSALYAGLGQSLGAVLGGRLQQMVGTAQMFRLVSVCNAILVGIIVLVRFMSMLNFAPLRKGEADKLKTA